MVDMNLMTSSATDQWATPQVVYDNIIDHLGIDPQWDLSADSTNTKCPNFIDEKQDSLVTKWPSGEVCWLNPPYGNMLKKFALKCATEFDGPNPPAKVVWLVPARTDTSWFNTLTTHAKCSKVLFLRDVSSSAIRPRMHPSLRLSSSWIPITRDLSMFPSVTSFASKI